MWNEIADEEDLNSFMDAMYGFHDSCVKEIKYISGAYVEETLSMFPINNRRILSVIIQRQFKNPSVIEMQFMGLKYLRLFPNDENYTSEILDATMIILPISAKQKMRRLSLIHAWRNMVALISS